jgi:hypothetical protein
MLTYGFRSVSGLVSGLIKTWQIAFPRQTQWLYDPPQLTYRCGGSAGIIPEQNVRYAPASRLIPWVDTQRTPEADLRKVYKAPGDVNHSSYGARALRFLDGF